MAGEPGVCGIATVAPPERDRYAGVHDERAEVNGGQQRPPKPARLRGRVLTLTPGMTSLSPTGRDAGRVRLISSVGAMFMVGPGRATPHHLQHR